MRPIIILLMALLLTVVISCSIRNYRLPERAAIINTEIPSAPVIEKIVVAPVPVPDTVREPVRDTATVVIARSPIHHIDTSALRSWLYDFTEHHRQEWLEEKEVYGIFDKWEKSLDESEAVVWQLVKALEDKEKAEQKAQIAQHVIYDVPTMFFFLGFFFTFFVLPIIYKQHYSRVKLEKQIENLKSCRTD